jgi:hypothetical protein
MDVSVEGGLKDTRGLYRVGTLKTVGSTSVGPGGNIVIADTGTAARVGDTFRAETGALASQEIQIIATTANSFTIASKVAPQNSDTYYILRPVTSRTNADGSLIASVSQGPTQFTRNGVDVTVNLDTVTPANSRGFPTSLLNTAGSAFDPATAQRQDTGNTSLSSIDTKTPALVSGRVPVDGSGVIQPVSGTFWQATQPVSGPLTDTQLRASAVPVSGTFYQATQPVSGPLTDTQLRASAVPVSGAFFQATQPVSLASVPTHAVTQSGSWTSAQVSPTAKTVKSANITVGTTAVRATNDGAAVTAGRVVLKVKPNPANTGAIYIGSSGVTTATGMLVLPAETMEFNFDAGEYYLISDTAAQSCFVLEQE